MKIIGTIEDVFSIKGRGLVATVILEEPNSNICVGDELEIVKNDGSVVQAVIAGLEMGLGPFARKGVAGILFRLEASEVSVGDKLRSVSE